MTGLDRLRRNCGLIDSDGNRVTCFATSTKGGQLADLELRYRLRATVRGPGPAPRGTDLRNFPAPGIGP
jgi:hypothetical protein